jgi:hypothetical protein
MLIRRYESLSQVDRFDPGGMQPAPASRMSLQYLIARTGLIVVALGAVVACNREPAGLHTAATPGRESGVESHAEPAQPATGSDELRGREVTVRARSQDVASDVAFWVNHEGRRLLVVVNRDRRTDAQRYVGVPALHGIANLEPNVPVTVRGRVEPLPHAEAMYSWNLTEADLAALRRETSYLRAETVTPE